MPDWQAIAGRMKVVTLSPIVQLLVPSLIFPTFSRSTRGVSFQPGKIGFAMGCVVLLAAADVAWLLWGPVGIAAASAAFWLIGSSGIAMLTSSLVPLAFVKPICVRCRLLPVIKEHEAIHLSGVARERIVWASMRERHSVESLKLEGDPSICWFCPIPKRLKEH